MFYKIVWLIIYPLFRILFPVKYEGKENIPKDKGFIICSNHISDIDPIYIALGFRTPVHFLAKEELFKNSFFNWLFKKLNAFPVKRGTGDKGALNVGADLIKSGEIMGIFPEGTRSKTGNPQRAKSGIALVASLASADVVPAAIICKGKIRPFKAVRVKYGNVIPYEELKITEANHGELKRVTELIMANIIKLWEDGHAN